MLLDKSKSCLVLVDVQEKLTPLIYNHEHLVANCKWVLALAKTLQVEIVVSEQYPKGLGQTIAELNQFVTEKNKMEKVHFSCGSDKHCVEKINSLNKNQVVLIGIEAHVCVLQTALELKLQGKEVYIVEDCVSSRNPDDKQLGVQRMRDNGCEIVSREMVFFEWVHQAGTPDFKTLSKQFLQG